MEWTKLTMKEKESVLTEVLELSRRNVILFYKDEIKDLLAGKEIPYNTLKVLRNNGVLGKRNIPDENIVKKYHKLIYEDWDKEYVDLVQGEVEEDAEP